MVVLDIDVLGSWVHLWDFGNFKGSTVVFKDSAVDCGLSRDHLETLFLEFLHKLHEWNCGTKCSQQTNEIALCGAEGNLHLELGCPDDWAASIHDNVAMPGMCSVSILSITLTPVACKVLVHMNIK